ncbi:MAG: allantoinase AllB [Saprospiraceae bacterium]
MTAIDFALYSDYTWIDQAFRPATVLIKAGKIVAWENRKISKADFPIRDFANHYLMPGIIDAHVHVNEPGRTEWEGFASATKAAAAGGITTLVDMPLNASPVTTSVENLQIKLAATKNKLHINCGFWGGFVPDSLNDLEALIQAGVLGIKVFLTHSGIDEFPNVTLTDLEKALPILRRHGSQILVHCELDFPHAAQDLLKAQPQRYAAYLASRPRAWENEAVRMMIHLCRKYQVQTHIVHLSSTDVLAEIIAAKAAGLPLTVETCPQYLFFNAEDIPDGDTRFKCAPPIRERENNEGLWQALEDGIIDFVATDHSPAPPELKKLATGNFAEAWGGIAGLQCLLPVVWTAARRRQLPLSKLVKWLVEAPAQFLQLDHRKGKIKAGYDADLVVWQPEQAFVLQEEQLHHKHKISPYVGEKLYGKVTQTYLGGKLIFAEGIFPETPQGEIILHQPTDS